MVNLPVVHPAHRHVDILIIDAPDDALAHDATDFRSARVGATSTAAIGDVAVGEYADQAIILAHQQAADGLVAHHSRCLLECGGGSDPFRVVAHRIANEHRLLLLDVTLAAGL